MFPFDCVGMTEGEITQAMVDDMVFLSQGYTVVYIEDDEEWDDDGVY